jgi:uncharacterized protein YukE
VEPLSEALDWLAGDPGQIAAHAQTWRNVASSLRAEAESLGQAVRVDITDWSGVASDAYRSWAVQRGQSLEALARASDTLALMTEGAGLLVGTVRIMVRDAVATVVSRLIVYAGELIASVGLATALVAEQVSTLCAAWAARIARWLRELISSIRNLLREGDNLARLIELLKNKLGFGSNRGGGPETPDPLKPPADRRMEEERLHALGVDPAVAGYRASEAETAHRIELQLGIELRRSTNPQVDWVDSLGTTYDAVGNFDGRHFERQWPNLQQRIIDHLEKADFVPVDVSRFSPEQKRLVADFIADNGYGPRAFVVGR